MRNRWSVGASERRSVGASKCLASRSHTRHARHAPYAPHAAFTLMEVMIAGGILFVCLFGVLQLVSTSLRNARLIQQMQDDPRSSVAALVYAELGRTNSIDEGSISGEFEGCRYEGQIKLSGTNGLYLVDLIVIPRSGNHMGELRAPFLLYNGNAPMVRRMP